MEALVVRGGIPLQGEVEIHGAKNAVLPILAASVIGGGTYLLHNCPQITDVELAAEIITGLGGQVKRLGSSLWVDTSGVCRWDIPAAQMVKMRASVLFLGALLARFGKAELTMPGGCPLGRRPIDLHLEAMAQMGTGVMLYENRICCEAPLLHGCHIHLPFPSVGATENILLAAMGCHGVVRITGAAREPEIGDLIRFLCAAGAEIRGADTDTLTIYGGTTLRDCAHTILPDRIETATYLCAAAGCGGKILLKHTDGELLQPVLDVLQTAGCNVEQGSGQIILQAPERLCMPGNLETAPYPGFPTDAQAPVMAALLRAEGSIRFTESIFERRFSHAVQLQKLGADIEVAGPAALVRGVPVLHGAAVEGSDLRAAAALVIAALQTEEKTVITGLKHLDRGYDNLEGNLRKLGAELVRIPV